MIEYTGKKPEPTSEKRRLTDKQIQAINSILSKDQRVELIPTKTGVTVFRVRREDSDLRPADYKSAALPAELRRQKRAATCKNLLQVTALVLPVKRL